MINRALGSLCAVAATLLLAATAAPVALAQDTAFTTLEGGVKGRTLQAGDGPEAEQGMVATVHVIGWVNTAGTRGRELYNTRRDGDVISFVIGTDKVMPAWNAGVVGMRAGERRMLLVPAAMGYGDRRVDGLVEPGTSLMLQLELVRLGKADATPEP